MFSFVDDVPSAVGIAVVDVRLHLQDGVVPGIVQPDIGEVQGRGVEFASFDQIILLGNVLCVIDPVAAVGLPKDTQLAGLVLREILDAFLQEGVNVGRCVERRIEVGGPVGKASVD